MGYFYISFAHEFMDSFACIEVIDTRAKTSVLGPVKKGASKVVGLEYGVERIMAAGAGR